MCLRRFCLTLWTCSESFLSSLCLRPVGFWKGFWISAFSCCPIFSWNVFLSVCRSSGWRHNRRGAGGGWTPWPGGKSGCCPSSEGRGRHLQQAAAHCGNNVFCGSLKGDEGSHRSRAWLWPHFTHDQVHQCQPTPGFSSTALSNTTAHEAALVESESCVVTEDWPTAQTSVSSSCRERLMGSSTGMERGFLTAQLNPNPCV